MRIPIIVPSCAAQLEALPAPVVHMLALHGFVFTAVPVATPFATAGSPDVAVVAFVGFTVFVVFVVFVGTTVPPPAIDGRPARRKVFHTSKDGATDCESLNALWRTTYALYCSSSDLAESVAP